ncbi:MAG: OB-fold domain-containing protein [Acidimicrobiia bacterium]|nr:OB-fold domain-containing protein [Acidimicrobiia bacterium]
MSEPTGKNRVPAVEGLFTIDDPPHLLGGKVPGRESYFFPMQLAGGDPVAGSGELDEVLLSRTGRIWSYTNSAYPPPPPYVVTTEPFVPVTIAAVELDHEKMVVLGQVVDGYTVDDLRIGMEVELVVDTLYRDDDNEYLVWKWAPVTASDAATGERDTYERDTSERGMDETENR